MNVLLGRRDQRFFLCDLLKNGMWPIVCNGALQRRPIHVIKTADRRAHSPLFHANRLRQSHSSRPHVEDADHSDMEKKKTDNTVSRKRRQRHHFRGINSTEEIPSFRDFQQKMQVRSLYRQYLRLLRPLNDSTQATELRQQLQREFRMQQNMSMDQWQIQSALSEGSRRYKELSSLLGIAIPQGTSTGAPTSTERTGALWPWQKESQGTGEKRPPISLSFPPKSVL